MKNIIRFIQYQHIINRVLKEEDIVNKLSQQFGAKFEVDRLGRIWTVLNPHIQNMQSTRDGASSLIYQYNEDNTVTNDEHIRQWVMQQLNIANMFIRENNLWELFGYDLKRVDGDMNYLFVIKNIYADKFLKSVKYAAVILPLLVVAGVLCWALI